MKAVVITGASSGIGRACALLLDSKGFRVFAGVRKEADGAALHAEASGPLTPVYIDVTDEASIAAMADQVDTAVGSAGLAGSGEQRGVHSSRTCRIPSRCRVFAGNSEVNLVGPLAVTQALLAVVAHRSRAGRQRHVGGGQGGRSADGAVRGRQAWPGRPERRITAGVPPIGRTRLGGRARLHRDRDGRQAAA